MRDNGGCKGPAPHQTEGPVCVRICVCVSLMGGGLLGLQEPSLDPEWRLTVSPKILDCTPPGHAGWVRWGGGGLGRCRITGVVLCEWQQGSQRVWGHSEKAPSGTRRRVPPDPRYSLVLDSLASRGSRARPARTGPHLHPGFDTWVSALLPFHGLCSLLLSFFISPPPFLPSCLFSLSLFFLTLSL